MLPSFELRLALGLVVRVAGCRWAKRVVHTHSVCSGKLQRGKEGSLRRSTARHGGGSGRRRSRADAPLLAHKRDHVMLRPHRALHRLSLASLLLVLGSPAAGQPSACPAGPSGDMLGAARCFGAAAAQQPWLGHATAAGTASFAARSTAAAHFRRHPVSYSGVDDPPGRLMLSSLGIGTYLGGADEATDARVAAAVVTVRGQGSGPSCRRLHLVTSMPACGMCAALGSVTRHHTPLHTCWQSVQEGAFNVIDTAANYRYGAAEVSGALPCAPFPTVLRWLQALPRGSASQHAILSACISRGPAAVRPPVHEPCCTFLGLQWAAPWRSCGHRVCIGASCLSAPRLATRQVGQAAQVPAKAACPIRLTKQTALQSIRGSVHGCWVCWGVCWALGGAGGCWGLYRMQTVWAANPIPRHRRPAGAGAFKRRHIGV